MPYNTTLTGLERNLATAQARAEFNPKVVAAWLEGLRGKGLGLALPALILKLDALTKADLDPRHRAAVLQLLKRPVLKAAGSLPKPIVASSDYAKGAGSGLTIEQRLLSAMQINTGKAFYDLAKIEYRADPQCDDVRAWAVRNLFHFIERQLRYVIEWRVAWPPGLWQEIHDLHDFLEAHHGVYAPLSTRLDATGAEQANEQPLDLGTAYKRLLLLGLASQFKPTCGDDQQFFDNVDDWAANSCLIDPQTRIWRSNLYVVEMSQDSPPVQKAGVLDESFRGWVLEPARDFLVYVGRAPALEGSGQRPFDSDRPAAPLQSSKAQVPTGGSR